jgi:hypothetical protein
MQPFWTIHSPAEIALETMFDAVWCLGFVVGWCIALWQHFSQSEEDAMWGRLFDALPTISRDEDLTPDQRHQFWADTRLSSTVSIG